VNADVLNQAPLHYELVKPAIEAGKDVFVEWPLGNGIAQAEDLAKAAKAKGIKTAVGLQGRHGVSILKVHAVSYLACMFSDIGVPGEGNR
jgi:predicted dehydrogenase